MVDSKTTALTALTTFSGDELFYVVEDDDGTPVSRKVTIEDLAAGLAARTELTSVFAPLPAYSTYSPTVRQNGDRTTSSLTCRYMQIGKLVHAYGTATLSNAGTTNNAITVTLPVAPNTSADAFPVGTGQVDDTGTANYRGLVANMVTSASPAYIRFFRDNTTSGASLGESGGPAFALASGDIIKWNITYEAA